MFGVRKHLLRHNAEENALCDVAVLNFSAVSTPKYGTVSPLARIIGRFQALKTATDGAPFLCQYLDILKNPKGTFNYVCGCLITIAHEVSAKGKSILCPNIKNDP